MLDKLTAFFKVEQNDAKTKATAKDRFIELKGRFLTILKKLDAQGIAIYIGITILMLLLVPWLVGFFEMVGFGLEGKYTLAYATTQSVFEYMLIGICPGLGFGTTLLFYVLGFSVMAITIIIRSPALSPIAETDARGVDYAEKSTYGSARWMSRVEAEKVFQVGDISEATGYILGQFTSDGKECISLPTTSSGNQNYLIIGSPGRGKTFSFGFNAVLQSLIRGESVIIVDPKGELCEKLYNLFVQHDYNVKVYNLVHPERSNAWNFAGEIFDVDTGNLDFNRLTAFVDIVMTNTMDGEKEDGFWGPGERNLFQAATAYLGWRFERTYADNMNRAADQWETVNLPYLDALERKRMFSIIRNEKSNLRDKEESLKTIMCGSGLVTQIEITSYMKELKEASDPVTIDRIFGIFVKYDLNGIIQLFGSANIPTSHPASIAWSVFEHSDAKIQPNFILGLSQRLKLFANTDINSMSAHDDISFRELGERKTAIFCVMSDKDSSCKLLSSLFFSFLFRDASDAADKLGPKNRIPVNVMCDEFANIGRIPDFERFIATVRSRKIYLTIIIQSIAQLAKVYDENDQETLIECCDTVLFLGCNGALTAQFISELSGVASIITSSVKDEKNITGMRGMAQGYSTSDGAGKRYLVNPDEARRLGVEEVLIYHAGQPMLSAKRCGYICHPLYKAGLPDNMPLSHYPTTIEMYGEYASIFDEVSDVDLKNQKTWNEVNARLMQIEQKSSTNTERRDNEEVAEDAPVTDDIPVPPSNSLNLHSRESKIPEMPTVVHLSQDEAEGAKQAGTAKNISEQGKRPLPASGRGQKPNAKANMAPQPLSRTPDPYANLQNKNAHQNKKPAVPAPQKAKGVTGIANSFKD